MPAAKFDPSKPYGTIAGDHFGRVYDQGGKQFNAKGDEVVVTYAMRAERDADEAELNAVGSTDERDSVIVQLKRKLADLAAREEQLQ